MPWPRSNYIHPNQDNTLVASGSRISELLALQVRPLHDYQHCCVDKVWSSSTRRTMKPLLAFPEALSFTYVHGPRRFARSTTAWLGSVMTSTAESVAGLPRLDEIAQVLAAANG